MSTKNCYAASTEESCTSEPAVRNLQQELEDTPTNDVAGILTEADKIFFMNNFTNTILDVNETHKHVLTSTIKRKELEASIKRKLNSRLDGLTCELVTTREENGKLSQKVRDLKDQIKSLKAECNFRCTAYKEKKLHEISKLKLQIVTLTNNKKDLENKTSANSTNRRLKDKVLEHKKTKEIFKIKMEAKDHVIDLLKKDKVDLRNRQKELNKKLDSVEKEYRSFHKAFTLEMTKHQRQLSLQTSRVSERLRDRKQKEDARQENFLQLQQQMKNACTGRSLDIQNSATDMVSNFRSSAVGVSLPSATNNFATQPPPPPTPPSTMTNGKFEHLFNHYSKKTIADNENRLMQLSVEQMAGPIQESSDSDMGYDMQEPDYYEVKKTSVVTPNGEHKRKDTARSKSNKRQKPELPTRSKATKSVFELSPPSEDEDERKSQPLLSN